MNEYAQRVLDLRRSGAMGIEYLQSVTEVFESIGSVIEADPRLEKDKILDRMTIPERVISFQVPWLDDNGEIQVNNGYRVQFNSALGPYKGGLRFHPSVNLSVLKFLGFEQTFKNSLTTLPIGGGKGGSDFNPRGKTDREVMNFCNSFMRELYRHIGPETDVPAGDIGVGARNRLSLGKYKRLTNTFNGVLTGKGLAWGGSLIRTEATGYGAIYFVQHMLAKKNQEIIGKKIALSGFGNVAWGAALKATTLGAKVITISGPDGYILDEDGLDFEKVAYMLELRSSGRDIVAPYTENPRQVHCRSQALGSPVDIAMPCAIQNELNGEDAAQLVANKVEPVAEVSNM